MDAGEHGEDHNRCGVLLALREVVKEYFE